MNFDKATAILAGTLVMILGGKIIYNPKLYTFVYQRQFDLTGFNVPLGIAVIIFGAFFIWIDVIKPKKGNLICSKCEELFRWTESLEDKCPVNPHPVYISASSIPAPGANKKIIRLCTANRLKSGRSRAAFEYPRRPHTG